MGVARYSFQMERCWMICRLFEVVASLRHETPSLVLSDRILTGFPGQHDAYVFLLPKESGRESCRKNWKRPQQEYQVDDRWSSCLRGGHETLHRQHNTHVVVRRKRATKISKSLSLGLERPEDSRVCHIAKVINTLLVKFQTAFLP